MFVDTHCHLNIMVKEKEETWLTKEHFEKIAVIVDQALQQNVTQIVNVGTSLRESINSVEIAKRFDDVYATVGIHPCSLGQQWKKDFDDIKNLLKKERGNIVAIGEVGLDFYHKPYDKQRQYDAFKAHINLALNSNLPLSIHVREAGDELLTILQEYAKDIDGRAVIHCFCQSQYFADTVLDWGFCLGIDAPITYPKNDQLRDIVTATPLKNILLETDAPFLPPQSYRGKQNTPAYIPIFAQHIADLRGVSLESLAQATTQNAQTLFRLGIV